MWSIKLKQIFDKLLSIPLKLPVSVFLNLLKPVINFFGIARFQSVCPVCESKARFEFKNIEFIICKCISCNHAFVKNNITDEILKKKYGSWNYWLMDKVHQGIKTVDPGDHWKIYIAARMKIIDAWYNQPTSNPRVFEIGASEGVLLHELQKRGFETQGIEMNGEIVEKSRPFYKQDIVVGDFLKTNFDSKKFDLIISFHTFEHLTDVPVVMKKCHELLEDRGMLLIEVPFGSGEYKNLDHLHFFSEHSCQLLFEKYFKDVKIQTNSYQTAGQDLVGSYYVSGIKH